MSDIMPDPLPIDTAPIEAGEEFDEIKLIAEERRCKEEDGAAVITEEERYDRIGIVARECVELFKEIPTLTDADIIARVFARHPSWFEGGSPGAPEGETEPEVIGFGEPDFVT
jgi:hypothetical protein